MYPGEFAIEDSVHQEWLSAYMKSAEASLPKPDDGMTFIYSGSNRLKCARCMNDEDSETQMNDMVTALVATYHHIEELTKIQCADGVGQLNITDARSLACKLVDAIIAKNIDKVAE